MKQAILFVVAAALQLCAATIINTNQQSPSLGLSPWISPPIVNFAQWNSDIYSNGLFTVANGSVFTVQYGGSSASRQNSVSATNASNGATFWTVPTWQVAQWISIKGTTLVIATTNYFAGFNAATGAVMWNVSIVVNYQYYASTPAVWVDDDCFLAAVGTGISNSKVYHIIAATGEAMILWNSTDLTGNVVSSYLSPNGPMVVQNVMGSIFAIVPFSNTFIPINISNASAAKLVQYVSGSSSFSGNTYYPIVVNSTVYFFGGNYGFTTSDARIYSYDLTNASNTNRYDFSGLQIQETRLYSANGTVGFVHRGLNYTGNCILMTTTLTGVPTSWAGNVLATSGGDYDCSILSWASDAVYLQDTARTIYRYTYGSNGYTWQTATLAVSTGFCSSGTQIGQYLNGKLFYGTNGCYNGSSSIDGWTVQINAMTGAYETLIPTPNSAVYAPYGFAYDAYTMGGVVVQYGRKQEYPNDYPYLQAFSISTSGGAATWLPSAMINTPVVYMGKVYLFSSNEVYCYGLQNGTLLWSASTASAISSSIQPVVAGGSLFVPTSSTSRNVYVFDLYNAVPSVMITIPTKPDGCPFSTNSPTSFVSDPSAPYVYFAGGTGSCVVQFTKTISTATGSPSDSSSNVYNPPTINGDFVFFNDNAGKVYFQRISSFGSSLAIDRMKSLTADDTYSSPSPLTVDQGEIFTVSTGPGTSPDLLYRFGAKTLLNDMKAAVPSADANIPPITKFKNVYLMTTNGSFAAYPSIPPLFSKTTDPLFIAGTPSFGTNRLGYPVITDFGVFVFANVNGIIAYNYNSAIPKWIITQDASNRTLTCSQAVAQRTGVAYVICNSTLYLIDILKGQIWTTGPQLQAAPVVVVDNSNDMNLDLLNIVAGRIVSFSNLTQRLYAPSALPPSIDGQYGWGDIIKNNKIWIAAVVAVVVVLIIIIAVAVKLCGGGKKDTDYVAMQNPVNTGGV